MLAPRTRAWGVLAATCLLAAACSHRADRGPVPLRMVLHSGPQGLDPHLHDEVATHWALDNIYDSLVVFDASMRLHPALALSWYNPDDLTWRFKLRQGVRFQDGRLLEAADVVASLQRARTHPQSKMSSYLVEVAAVRALDPLTIEVQTLRPYPILLNKLTFIAIVPRDAPALITSPIGTGPYRLVTYDPGRHLDLQAFPGTWHFRPAEPKVSIDFESDARKRVESLLAGQTDLIAELPAQYTDRIAGTKGLSVRAGGSLGVTYLQPELDAKPLSDVRVRRAISLALDRDGLVAAMLNGRGTPASQMVVPKVFGYAPEIPPIHRDVAAARRLLAEAGYPAGIDVPLEFRSGQELEPLRAQLAEAGIRVHLAPEPWTQLYPRYLKGQLHFYYGTWLCSSGDASDLFDFKIHTRDLARSYGDSNSNNYSNPTLDKLLESAGATLSMNERGRILETGMRALSTDLPLIPLFIQNYPVGVRQEIEWTPRLDFRIHAEDMRRLGD